MKKIFQSDEFNIFEKMTFLKKHIPAFEFNKSLHKDNLFEFTKLEESYNPYDASHPHRHNYFEVLYFNGAGGIHEIDFQSYPIEKIRFILFRPGKCICFEEIRKLQVMCFRLRMIFFLTEHPVRCSLKRCHFSLVRRQYQLFD